MEFIQQQVEELNLGSDLFESIEEARERVNAIVIMVGNIEKELKYRLQESEQGDTVKHEEDIEWDIIIKCMRIIGLILGKLRDLSADLQITEDRIAGNVKKVWDRNPDLKKHDFDKFRRTQMERMRE